MGKENLIYTNELDPLVTGLAKSFIQRWDLYPKQLEDGSYICIHKSLTQNHILAHLRGDITIGAYLLDPESHARYIVIDADNAEQMDGLFRMSRSLEHHGLVSYLERSRRGGHLWLFFNAPVAGKEARAFGHGLMAAHGLQGVELYPKQDRLGDGPGSLIRLPFGIHRGDMQRYGFITPFGQPLASRLRDQIPLFYSPKTVPQTFFDRNLKGTLSQVEKTEIRAVEAQGETLSETIKASMPVYDFVSQYVELSSTGRGLCPFHDDQHASFSVNVEKNFWHCFAGCGGSSVIDFWMKWKECDFTTAIHELAEILIEYESEK